MKKRRLLGHQHTHFYKAAGIDYYACQSRIRHWNGCYKVCAAVWILILCLILDHPWVSAFVILTVGAINLIGNGVSFWEYLSLIKVPIAFLVMGCGAIAFGISPDPKGDWYIRLPWFFLYFTVEAFIQAAELFLKAMGAISVLYLMALSTPASEIVMVMRKMHMPKLLTELMYMMYRFIFILTEVHSNLKTAAISRLGDADFRTSCVTFGKIGANLLILSLKKANTYYDAMVSRGYDGEFFFWEEEKPVRIWQILSLGLYTVVLICLERNL